MPYEATGLSIENHLTAVNRHSLGDHSDRAMGQVWRVLVDAYFQKWISPEDAVLDVGAGRCNFINRVKAGRKVAVDADPDVATYVGSDVEFVQASSLQSIDLGGEFDVAFVSNFLEHLDNADAVLTLLADLRHHLKPDGRVLILQPNFALLGAKYFDVIDHKTILTDDSLAQALEVTDYEIEFLKKRFLPYSSRSRLPKAAWMVRLYLAIPPAQFVLGKQTFVVAKPRQKTAAG
jgi:SAM-dependent methyltransferase